MNTIKLQYCNERLNNIGSKIVETEENTKTLIQGKNEEIERLKREIKELENAKNREISRLNEQEDEALKAYKEELAKIDVFGTFNIYHMVPILIDLTKVIGHREATLRVVRGDAIVINGEFRAYTLDLMVLECPLNEYVLAKSPAPTKEDDLSSHFGVNHQLATYDCNEGTFVYCELSCLYSMERIPSYLKEFISYASNYRLEHDLKEISGEELKELEEKFLEENKEKYNGQARKRGF